MKTFLISVFLVLFGAFMFVGCGSSSSSSPSHDDLDTPPMFPGWDGEIPK